MANDSLRRKLLKGSLSAPLVLTVGTAGAQAQTSVTTCLQRGIPGQEPLQVVAYRDELFRVTRDVYDVYRTVGARRDKIEGRFILSWDNQTLYRLDMSGGQARLPRYSGITRTPDMELRPMGRVEVLAYVNDQGEVVGIAPQANNGRWAVTSCVASAVGAREMRHTRG